jgi:peptide/nickel transport system substrate-binding protein
MAEMTSADVAYTFRRFSIQFVSDERAFQDLVSVDTIDSTVAFRLKRPSASFPANLTQMGIVPEGSGPTASRKPIGSGPYRLVEFVADDHITLEAFGGYYQGPPRNAGLVFKVVPDETMRGLELRKGDVDLAINDFSPDIVHGLERTPGLSVITGQGTDFAYIGLNLRDPVLKDRRVRQAIGYAVDRDAIIRYLRRGQARETSGMVPSMSWAHGDNIFTFTHDVEKAKALLEEAGYRDPDGPGPQPRLRLSLKTSTSEPYRVQAAALQQQFAQVGIALDLRSFEFATMFADVIRGVSAYAADLHGWLGRDPDILRRVFHSTQTPLAASIAPTGPGGRSAHRSRNLIDRRGRTAARLHRCPAHHRPRRADDQPLGPPERRDRAGGPGGVTADTDWGLRVLETRQSDDDATVQSNADDHRFLTITRRD